MQLIEGGFGGWWRKYSAQQLAAANGVLAVLGFIGRFIRQTKEQQ